MAKRTMDSDFERVWEAYPRKVKKTDARKVWARLKDEGTLPDVEVLLEAIERHKRSDQWSKKCFIPYLANYLEGERWEDEGGTKPYEPKRYDGRTLAEIAREYYA